MVKCTNGVYTFCVTEGAYDNYYKPQGYTKVEEQNESVFVEDVDDEQDEVLEKPIGQWTKQEVKDFAAANGIDISGTRNVGQAKEIIKDFIERQAR